jgi:hypothetical protein
MSASSSSSSSLFSSVKLSSGWVSHARDAASSMRRSVAGKIGNWATLGRIAEASGLTVSDGREAIALYDVRQAAPADADLLDALEADFLAAESSGRLAQAWAKKVQPAKPPTPWVAQFWLGVRSARGWHGRCCGLRGRHVHPAAALAQRPMQP